MKAPIFYVFLLQALTCAFSSVSHRNVSDDEVFKLLKSYPGIPNGVRFNIESQSTTANVHLNFDSCGDRGVECLVEVRVDCAVVQKIDVSPTSTSFDFELSTVVGHSYELEFRKLAASARPTASPSWQPHAKPRGQQRLGASLTGEISLEGADFQLQKEAFRNQHPDCLHRHKMLVISNPIRVPSSATCAFRADTESEEHGFAALVAASVQADLHVVQNHQTSSEPMETDPFSTEVAGPSYWPPALFPADIVVLLVMLGDLPFGPNATYDPKDIDALVDQMHRMSVDYPQAKGYAVMCVPMSPYARCELSVDVAMERSDVEVYGVVVGPSQVDGGYGCDGHPNVAPTQQFMADVFMPYVTSMLEE